MHCGHSLKYMQVYLGWNDPVWFVVDPFLKDMKTYVWTKSGKSIEIFLEISLQEIWPIFTVKGCRVRICCIACNVALVHIWKSNEYLSPLSLFLCRANAYLLQRLALNPLSWDDYMANYLWETLNTSTRNRVCEP